MCGALLVGGFVRLGRKVAFAADSREVILVSTPVPRTQIPVKVRASFGQAAGEETTHDTSYTGVPSMAWQQMPRVSAGDKCRIWGADAERPRQELFDTTLGQPLLWQERKTPAFWACLLSDLCVKTVVDLTPGSGSAARACMQLGIPYHGWAKNAEHASWLQNVLDRAALQVICEVGSALHSDSAQAIQEHFSDVLEQLNEQDKGVDVTPDDGALDDA